MCACCGLTSHPNTHVKKKPPAVTCWMKMWQWWKDVIKKVYTVGIGCRYRYLGICWIKVWQHWVCNVLLNIESWTLKETVGVALFSESRQILTHLQWKLSKTQAVTCLTKMLQCNNVDGRVSANSTSGTFTFTNLSRNTEDEWMDVDIEVPNLNV